MGFFKGCLFPPPHRGQCGGGDLTYSRHNAPLGNCRCVTRGTRLAPDIFSVCNPRRTNICALSATFPEPEPRPYVSLLWSLCPLPGYFFKIGYTSVTQQGEGYRGMTDKRAVQTYTYTNMGNEKTSSSAIGAHQRGRKDANRRLNRSSLNS